jgi:hypothetical protein
MRLLLTRVHWGTPEMFLGISFIIVMGLAGWVLGGL